ncbi:MAG TPA: transcriptional regulator GcvA [Devosiaceae bacterium]|nr:transcriptional regulator GcvA [Devosiaceae bacterium]
MNIVTRTRPRLPQPTLARLPPLGALRAFVSVARHLSFSRAAGELHVTSAAIGQQIRLLEDHLGQPLFYRNRGELELTPTGRALMPGLTDAFEAVVQAIAQLSSADDLAPLRISVAPSFGAKWLMPRLGALRELLPGHEILVEASTELADLEADDFDCAIRYGLGAYPGLVSDRLFAEAVVPICSPAFAEKHRLDLGTEALGTVPLLHENGPERDPGCPDWRAWLRAAGLSPSVAEGGLRLSQSSLVIDAAAAGQGLALGKLRLAQADLDAGRLVSPFGTPQAVEFSYFLVTTPLKARQPKVERLRQWLLGRAASLQSNDNSGAISYGAEAEHRHSTGSP